MCLSCSTKYNATLQSQIRQAPTFKAIREFNIDHFPADGYSKYYRSLENGTAVLTTSQQLNAYMACYSDMHTSKLEAAFDALFNQTELHYNSLDVIDWGCGQALASCALIDYMQNREINNLPTKFILVDASAQAVERGTEHIRAIMPRSSYYDLQSLVKKINDVQNSELRTNHTSIKLHLFSNVLDMASIDLEPVAQVIKGSATGTNYFVCVSPVGEARLDLFYKQFYSCTLISKRVDPLLCQTFRPSQMKRITKLIQRIEYIFKSNL